MSTPRIPGQPEVLRVVQVPGKGRGVLAGRRFARHEVVETAPVIVIPGREWELVAQTVLARFIFAWDDRTGSTSVALGRVSLLNHSWEPNLAAEKHVASRTLRFIALRDIDQGEELTLNYRGNARRRDPLGFDVKP